MAVLEQSQTEITGIEQTTASVTMSAITEGNLLVAVMGAGNGAETVTPPSGWTEMESAGVSGQYDGRHMYYKVAGASEPTAITFTFSGVGDRFFLAVMEWSGLAAAPADVSANATSGGSSVASLSSGTTATTSQANELVIACVFAWGNDSGAGSWDNGFSGEFYWSELTVSGWELHCHVGTKTLTATDTPESTLTWTLSGQAGGIIGTFKEPSGATTSGELNAGGSITASVTKYENQVARPVSTITAGDWDTGPTPGQALHTYAGDDSDATWIEDTTV